ncbi:MAG: sulfatase-like hydrolase/transferase [Candidatus Coatesbacteria bacterium]|nr:MAG: sulfatase-like hydrolase/transferase [Candidatus Coatesbacteria bacterium]
MAFDERAKGAVRRVADRLLGPTFLDKAFVVVDGPALAAWAASLMLVAEIIYRWAAGIPLNGPGHYLFNSLLPAFATSTLAFYLVLFWILTGVVGVIYLIRQTGRGKEKRAGPLVFLSAHLLAFIVIVLTSRDLVFRVPPAFFDRFLPVFLIAFIAAFLGLGYLLTRVLRRIRYVFIALTKPVWTRIPFYIVALFIVGSLPGLWAARAQPWLPLMGAGETNVILITAGGVRADILEPYGGPVNVPNLERLADEGILFENAYSTAPWTGPALASVHTGRYPMRLGYGENNMNLNGGEPVVAEYLLKRGCYTKAFVGGPECHASYGFARGFASYVHWNRGAFLGVFYPTFVHDIIYRLPFYYDNSRGRGDEEVVSAAAEWLRENETRPFFLWVHLPGPELPYNLDPDELPGIPDDWRYEDTARAFVDGLSEDEKETLRPRLENAYKRELNELDAALGDVLDAVDSSGSNADTLIVFAGVSGEAPGEDGRFGHARDVYDENVHVPLVVRLPGGERRGETEDRPSSLVDVAPIVVKLATGEDLRSSGEVIVRVDADGSVTENRTVYSETAGRPERYARRKADRVFIYDMEKGTGELYNRRLFGGGLDLVEKPEETEALGRQLMNWREMQITRRAGEEPPSDTSRTTRLRDIGYLR